nr:YbhB/YbcL family Raf kinase inhibitor-like protein [Thermococcus sp.]
MSLKISSVFGENEFIPSKYACEGADISPPLKLGGLSDEAVTIGIIVDDPDAPVGTFTHWVAWNIPPTSEIPEGVPKEKVVETPIKMVQGRNDFGRIGYNGPCPPRGHGVHHYHFKVYVIDTTLNLKPGATKKDLERAMKGHIIQFGELVGLYERR